jgi:hypothetical protein
VDVSGGGVTTGSGTNSVYVQGRYAYVVDNGSSNLQIFDLGGEYTQQLEAGGAEVGTLAVDTNASISNDLSIGGGLTIGQKTDLQGNLGVNGNILFQGQTNSANTFQIEDSSNNVAVVVSTNNVTGSGNVANAILKLAKDSVTSRSINAAGSINASGADYAEYFNQTTPGALQAGDLVCLSPTATAQACSNNSSEMLVGAISINPGYVGNDIFDPAHPDNTALVGLLGQIPVKVSTANGPIHTGDMLTTSSESGVAVKATSPGMVLGSALADYTSSTDGEIMVYVHVGYYAPPMQSASNNYIQGGGSADLSSLNVSGATTLNDLTVTGTATVASLTVTNTIVTEDITVNGHIVTGGTTPTIATGTAACVGSTATISGTDTAGLITITTGTSCPGIGKLATLTFASAYGAAPRVSLTPAGVSAAHLYTYIDNKTINSAAFDLDVALGTVNTSTTYRWYYQVIQ